jgi:hypothetical protein
MTKRVERAEGRSPHFTRRPRETGFVCFGHRERIATHVCDEPGLECSRLYLCEECAGNHTTVTCHRNVWKLKPTVTSTERRET